VQGAWPYGFKELFGACSAAATAKAGRRCAETRTKAVVLTVVRPAIKKACSDAAIAGAVLPGG
jgi:hypothetical protein